MRKYALLVLMTLFFSSSLLSQTTQREKMLKTRKEYSNKTKFQQFEKDLVPTAEERLAKNEKIKARREKLFKIIDTSDIKSELKLRLKDDIVNNPFSSRLRKFMEKHELRDKVLKD